MRPLNWTVIATQVPPHGSLGGVVRYTTEMIRALAERDDVVVSALTTRAAADVVGEFVGDSGRVHTVPDAPVPLLSAVERYAPWAGRGPGTDVVHGVKHLLPRHTDALRVLTVHDMLLLDRPADFGRAKRYLLPPSHRASIRDADLLLCVSAATRDRLEANVAGAGGRADVVHLATSPALRTAVPTPVFALTGRRFALVVGDSSPRKNLGTIMSAWRGVRLRNPDSVLAVAGPPSWGRTELGGLYRRLVAEGSVVALGHVPDSELRWAYEHADVVLCPSLAEGFGLPAAEALDFGAPVVISDDPALQEVCAGRAAAVVPARDVGRWTAAVVEVLRRPRRTPPAQRRTWADVADESVVSVRRALARRQVAGQP